MGDNLIEQFKAERKAAPREEVLSSGPSAEYMRGKDPTLKLQPAEQLLTR